MSTPKCGLVYTCTLVFIAGIVACSDPEIPPVNEPAFRDHRFYSQKLSDGIGYFRADETENYDCIFTITRNNQVTLKDTLYGSFGTVHNEIDFDQDGDMDIIVCQTGGNHGNYFLYLWDQESGKFRKMGDKVNWPEAKRLLPDTKLFYDMDVAGNFNSQSYLFTLDKYEIKSMAHIYVFSEYPGTSKEGYCTLNCSINRMFGEEHDSLWEKLFLRQEVSREELIQKYWIKNYKLLKL